MRDLLLVVPSRGRPKNIARLCATMAATCQGDTTLLVGVDADDPALEEYRTVIRDAPAGEHFGPDRIELDINDRGLKGVVALMNWLAVPRASEYRFIGTLGDDNTCDTPGWDLRVIESLSDPRYIECFGDDLYPREKGSLCCHVFMRSEVIRALGYMGPPILQHMYVDPVWMAWGKALGIEFLADVQFEHHHYTVGKSQIDVSYMDSTSLIPADCLAYNRYCETQLNADIAKIRAGSEFSEDELVRFNRDLNIPPVFGGPLRQPAD